jgi:hypothetical protein
MAVKTKPISVRLDKVSIVEGKLVLQVRHTTRTHLEMTLNPCDADTMHTLSDLAELIADRVDCEMSET